MIFRDDVVFLIEEYTSRFGEAPVGVTGAAFPRKRDWAKTVHAIRWSLDSGQPVAMDSAPVHAQAALRAA